MTELVKLIDLIEREFYQVGAGNQSNAHLRAIKKMASEIKRGMK